MGKASSTQKAEIPDWLEDAARRNLRLAEEVSRIGPVPLTYGPTRAAFTPMQNAAFANTSDLASMLGLTAPTDTAAGGNMPDAVNYGGVTGYSAKPVYDAITGEFIADRPGQASYIDSFFIDPVTGQTVAASPNTLRATSSGDPMMQGAVAPTKRRWSDRMPYDPVTGQFTSDRMPKFREKDMRTVSGYESLGELDYNARATDYIDGMDTPGHLSLIGGDLENIALAASKGPKPFGIGDPTYRIGGINNPGNNPSLASMVASAPPGMRYNPATGGYVSDGSEPTNSIRPPTRGTAKEDLPKSSVNEGCVIATHAVSTGVYNYQTRREAEVWCMRKLHDKWWGETIRRGYRCLGRRKIEQGKASEHYDEFKRYIAFATGKKRDLRGALTFTLRSAQFFAVGLFARNS